MARPHLVAVLAAGSILAGCGNPIPPPQNYASVYGRVYDAVTNQPVAGAEVQVDAILLATSGSDGSYSVVNVPLGQVDVAVPNPPQGYAPGYEDSSVTAGERVRVDIPLTHS
jgi:hypothetical protein